MGECVGERKRGRAGNPARPGCVGRGPVGERACGVSKCGQECVRRRIGGRSTGRAGVREGRHPLARGVGRGQAGVRACGVSKCLQARADERARMCARVGERDCGLECGRAGLRGYVRA